MEKTEEYSLKNIPPSELEDLLQRDFEDVFNSTPLTEETTCGLGFIRGALLQKSIRLHFEFIVKTVN